MQDAAKDILHLVYWYVLCNWAGAQGGGWVVVWQEVSGEQ